MSGETSDRQRVTVAWPQRQTVFHVEGQRGNCFAACVASIIGAPLADVPNFCDTDELWWTGFLEWLFHRGLTAISVPARNVEGPFEMVCIANGQGPRGCRHSVVWQDDEMLWDPHPSDDGLLEDPDRYVLLMPLNSGEWRQVR